MLTTLNCVADPALYCFVSESARRGLYRAIVRPITRILCCCCRRGNASPINPANDSHEVATTDEINGHPNVTLLTHTSTQNNVKTDSKNTTLTTLADEKTMIPLTVRNNTNAHDKRGDVNGMLGCVITVEEQKQMAERTEENNKNIS